MAKKLTKTNASVTTIPQFESSNLSELESVKNQVIEDYYNPDNTPWEKRTYSRIIKKIELTQDQYAEEHYWLNGKLPDDSKSVISFVEPEPEIHNEIKLGIEGWDELEIKIGLNDVIFQKGNKSVRRPLKGELNWHKNLKIEVLRILSSVTILKFGHFRYNGKQSIKNAISELRKDLCSCFPDMPDDPIEFSRKGQGYISPIKITLLERDEYMVETSQRLESGLTYEQELNQETHMGYATYDSYDSVDEE